MKDQLAQMVALGERLRHAGDRHGALKRGLLEIYRRSLADNGCTVGADRVAQLLSIDVELNAQGMAVWLDRP